MRSPTIFPRLREFSPAARRSPSRAVIFTGLGLLGTLLAAQNSLEDGIRLLQNKQYPESEAVLNGRLKDDPKNPEVLFRLGQVSLHYYFDGEKAAGFLEQAVHLTPGNAEYHFGLGQAYALNLPTAGLFKKLRLASKMKAEFQTAVTLDPRHLPARFALLRFLLGAPAIAGGSVAEARKLSDATAQIDGAAGRAMRASILHHENNFPAAEKEYLAACNLASDRGFYYNQLGYFYLDQKREADGVRQFKKYVEAEPLSANAHDSLGEGLLALGRYDDAISALQRALELEPRSPEIYFLLGLAHERAGRKPEALRLYRLSLATNPHHPSAKQAEKKLRELGG